MKYENLLTEKEKLEELLDSKSQNPSTDEHQQLLQLKYKNYQLEQENKDLLKKLRPDLVEHRSPHLSPKTIDKNFQEQIPVSADHYKIPIAIRNKMVGAVGVQTGFLNSVGNFQNDQNQNVLQQPLFPMNSKSTTTTTTPTSVIKKEHLVTPVKAQPTAAKTSARAKPLPKGERNRYLNYYLTFLSNFILNFRGSTDS